MLIQPTDWVWFTYRARTQFCRFDLIHPELQYSIDQLFRQLRTYHMSDPHIDLVVHSVVPKEGEYLSQKVNLLFKGFYKPYYTLWTLPSGHHWVDGEMPHTGFFDTLNSVSDTELLKQVHFNYLRHICEFVKVPDSLKNVEHCDWQKHSEEIKKILHRKKPEESPMKVKNLLIEVGEYDKKKRKLTFNRDAVHIKTMDQANYDRKAIKTLHALYVNHDDIWDSTHEILSIGGSSYKMSSGWTSYDEERLRLLTNGKPPLLTLDLTDTKPVVIHHEQRIADGTQKITDTWHLPKSANPVQVIKYFQKKYPHNNYSLYEKKITKGLSKRSQELANLPKVGETPEKNLRKVCYKRKDGDGMIFRGPFEEVNKLVETGDYEFASKQAWKSQILETIIDEKGNRRYVLIKKGTDHKSNITQPLYEGRELGERKEKRKERQREKELKTLRKLAKYHRNYGRRKPGDAERTLQSERDKVKYVQSYKEKHGELPKSQRAYRAYEGVILGDKATVLETVNVKAKSEKHAMDILQNLVKQKKGVDCKLTGTIRDWVKPVGKNRPNKKKNGGR
jgi:hypothetical protein